MVAAIDASCNLQNGICSTGEEALSGTKEAPMPADSQPSKSISWTTAAIVVMAILVATWAISANAGNSGEDYRLTISRMAAQIEVLGRRADRTEDRLGKLEPVIYTIAKDTAVIAESTQWQKKWIQAGGEQKQ